SLTGVQKKELCKKKHNNPNLKGVNLAKEYGISEQSVSDILKCSEYWLGLDDASTLIQVKREAGSVPLEDILNFCLELQDVFRNYEPKDIFNYDETALFWKKKSKDRVIAMITCNSTGDEKLPLFFIHKYKTSRVLRGIEKSTLPVWASILSSMEILDDNFTSMHEETESEASVFEKAELETEIINLIERLPIDDPLDVQEYIEVDNYMNIEEDLTINEIIDIVNGQDESESEKEHEEMVKIGNAIVGLDNLIKYI
ncbi:45356_t:CDS:2, partial [Gigaspora margarita]